MRAAACSPDTVLVAAGRGVRLHRGLAVPVSTPASGSAFDIAGEGLARIDGRREASALNVRMAAVRR